MVAQLLNTHRIFISAMAVLVFWCCSTNSSELHSIANPPSEGFDLAHSDPAAVELADSVMVSMGGRNNWDMTRFISWNFSGLRSLVWDKELGRLRITSHDDSTIYLMDLRDRRGRVQVKGKEVTDKNSLQELISKGLSIWAHDSYWLCMPFKLKDSGVTLKYMGEDLSLKGEKCNVLQLTVNQPGDVPQSKYMVFVDRADNLVKQWAYYSQASQDTSDFTRPWDNYAKYGSILLSSDRSDGEGPKDVKVETTLPDDVFTAF